MMTETCIFQLQMTKTPKEPISSNHTSSLLKQIDQGWVLKELG